MSELKHSEEKGVLPLRISNKFKIENGVMIQNTVLSPLKANPAFLNALQSK